MSRFPVKPLVFCAGAALLLSSCGNPFGASTDSGSSSQAARSSSSSSSSSASTSASASPTHSPTASATSSSASPSPSVSVVTVTANPQPEASTVTVTASSNSNSGSSSSSGRSALDSNASKLRGHHSWSLSSADTSTFDSSAELSWITVGSSMVRHILCCSITETTWEPARSTRFRVPLRSHGILRTRFRPLWGLPKRRSPGIPLRKRLL